MLLASWFFLYYEITIKGNKILVTVAFFLSIFKIHSPRTCGYRPDLALPKFNYLPPCCGNIKAAVYECITGINLITLVKWCAQIQSQLYHNREYHIYCFCHGCVTK